MRSFLNKLKSTLFSRERKQMLAVAQDPVWDAYQHHRPEEYRSAACHAPFKSLYFNLDGTVTACCVNHTFVLGRYPGQSVEEIWNGKRIQEFRDHLTKFDLTHGCQECLYHIKNGNFEDVRAAYYDQFGIGSGYPVILDFVLENTCNLECVMCSGEFSSSIRKNRERLPALKMKYDMEFTVQLLPFIPHLKLAQFAGGEPFLMPVNFAIWEKIISMNPECVIGVQSNGTVLNKKVMDMLDRGNFHIGISIDSLTKEVYEKIRVNSDFERVLDHIRYFAAYCLRKGHPMHLTVCPMRSNWNELPEILSFCNELGIYMRYNLVWRPHRFALWTLSSGEIREILGQLASVPLSDGNPLISKNNQYFRNFLLQLDTWHKEAVKREESQVHLDLMEAGAMKRAMISKLESYLEGSGAVALEITREEGQECLGKLNRVFEMFPEDARFKNAMVELDKIDPYSIFRQLKDNSVDSFYQLALHVMGGSDNQ